MAAKHIALEQAEAMAQDTLRQRLVLLEWLVTKGVIEQRHFVATGRKLLSESSIGLDNLALYTKDALVLVRGKPVAVDYGPPKKKARKK